MSDAIKKKESQKFLKFFCMIFRFHEFSIQASPKISKFPSFCMENTKRTAKGGRGKFH